jgi:hydroxysqualene dehydroxylase
VRDVQHRQLPSQRVAVVGGGWAGCAAAVTLAQAGFPVSLFEQAKTLGGRARRVLLDGVVVDNGQHLLVGAYRQTLELLAVVHGRKHAAERFCHLPLTLCPFGAPRPGDVAFAAWRAPAPLHLAGALLAASGLTWRDRLAVVAGFRDLARARFRCPSGQTVAERFARAPRSVVAALWDPLCLAALNTPPERASAQAFAQVLREAFTGAAEHSDFLVPASDLSSCFPDAAARFVAERGGSVRLGTTVRAIENHADHVVICAGKTTAAFASVVVAVGPHQLERAIGATDVADREWREILNRVSAFSYESITTIYLRFAASLPMRVPLLRLDDTPGHWIFQHPARAHALPEDTMSDLYAVVISGGGPHDTAEHTTLINAVVSQLRRLAPELPPVLWSRVIAERRATYACTPGLLRPTSGRVTPRIYLAGDYTEPELPATLEAATRSGVAAAHALLADDLRTSA